MKWVMESGLARIQETFKTEFMAVHLCRYLSWQYVLYGLL